MVKEPDILNGFKVAKVEDMLAWNKRSAKTSKYAEMYEFIEALIEINSGVRPVSVARKFFPEALEKIDTNLSEDQVDAEVIKLIRDRVQGKYRVKTGELPKDLFGISGLRGVYFIRK